MLGACKVQRASSSPVTFCCSLGTWFMLCTCATFSRYVSQRIVWLLMLTLFQTRENCLTRPSVEALRKKLFPLLSSNWVLCSLQVEIKQQPSEFIMNKWILLSWGRPWGNFCTHRRVALLSFVFYCVYRSLFQSHALSLSVCLSVLSYLTLNHRCTHTHTHTHTHTDRNTDLINR